MDDRWIELIEESYARCPNFQSLIVDVSITDPDLRAAEAKKRILPYEAVESVHSSLPRAIFHISEYGDIRQGEKEWRKTGGFVVSYELESEMFDESDADSIRDRYIEISKQIRLIHDDLKTLATTPMEIDIDGLRMSYPDFADFRMVEPLAHYAPGEETEDNEDPEAVDYVDPSNQKLVWGAVYDIRLR